MNHLLDKIMEWDQRFATAAPITYHVVTFIGVFAIVYLMVIYAYVFSDI